MSSTKHRSNSPVGAGQGPGGVLHIEQEPMPHRKATPAGELARPEAALTRRERRVKKLLIKELERHSAWRTLTYAEKQHLDKSLNVEFIDEELAKIRKALRWMKLVTPTLSIIAGGLVLFSVVSLSLGTPFDFSTHLYWQLLILAQAGAGVMQTRSFRRKMFIYEALRELSDADEIDVTLSRAVEEADALIGRIVEKEVEADRRYLDPLGFHAN